MLVVSLERNEIMVIETEDSICLKFKIVKRAGPSPCVTNETNSPRIEL